MRVYTLGEGGADLPRDMVLAIGNFDAVHLGHAALLSAARAEALTKNLPFGVLTLEPHPRRLFRPDDLPFRVTPPSVKIERLAALGAQYVFVLPFDWDIAALGVNEFITRVLSPLAPAALFMGEDFRFGHNRAGTPDDLRQAGYEARTIPLLADPQHGIISATRVRGLIQSGHIDEANSLLGWNWIMRGVVTQGDQRGRELGYPTANIPLGETIHPAYGVYATWVRIEGETKERMAATNIGIRPMFEVATALIEAHLLDFAGDLYGKTLDIRPVAKIRNEEKFGSLDELVRQIGADCEKCRALLERGA